MSNFQHSEPTMQRIRQLVQMPYGDYLKTDEWKAKRDATVERDGGRCRLCYSEKNLQVHHRTYSRRGNEDLNDLTTLCKECHEHFHSRVTEQYLHAQWGENSVPPTEEEQERRQKRFQEDTGRFLLGMLLLYPEEYQKTGIGQLVKPEDLISLPWREIYRFLADGNTGTNFADWLPSYLHEEAQCCVTFAANRSERDLHTARREISNIGIHLKLNILRQKNRDLEQELFLASESGDKQKERIATKEMASLLRQMREIDTVMRTNERRGNR